MRGNCGRGCHAVNREKQYFVEIATGVVTQCTVRSFFFEHKSGRTCLAVAMRYSFSRKLVQELSRSDL